MNIILQMFLVKNATNVIDLELYSSVIRKGQLTKPWVELLWVTKKKSYPSL